MICGHWTYNNDLTEDQIQNEKAGFVYVITNKTNGMQYIGRKFVWKTRDGKTSPSGWQHYCSSSKYLLKDIEQHGKHNFEFKILCVHKTKETTCKVEELLLRNANVLHAKQADGSPAYYNRSINGAEFCNRDPLTEQCKAKLSKAHKGRTLTQEHKQKISASKTGKSRSDTDCERAEQIETERRERADKREQRKEAQRIKQEEQAKRKVERSAQREAKRLEAMRLYAERDALLAIQRRDVEPRIVEIRTRKANGETTSALAKEYGLDRKTAREMVTGQSYKWASGPITPHHEASNGEK